VDQAFNTLDSSIAVSEENLANPPSATYFLPTPPPADLPPAEDPPLLEDSDEEEGTIRTSDLTSAHLNESEIKTLRRRMKKSSQWKPTQTSIKKELQLNGRWPLRVGRVQPRTVVRKPLRKEKKQKKKDNEYTMRVAPDEPTYCYCGDVSYGEMIACENEVCSFVEGIDGSFVRGSGFIMSVRG
jgi:hypothetical protein